MNKYQVEGDEVVARAGQVAEVFQGLAREVEFGTVAVELARRSIIRRHLLTPGLGTRNMRET
jgi:hypothetical protein